MQRSITDPAERVGFLMWQTAHAYGQQMAQDLAEIGMTSAQFGLLVHVTREPGISAAELSRRLNLTRQGIRSALQPLLDRGAVTSKPHPVHGRVQGLFATDSGVALAHEADARINGTETQMLGSFSAEERRRFHTLMHRAATAINPAAFDRTSVRPR